MAFVLFPGETVIWELAMTGQAMTGQQDVNLTVTTRRVIVERSGLGESSNRWIAVDKIDTAGYGRFRNPFPWKWFLIGLLLLIVPGLIVLLVWLFGRNDELVLTAGGSECLRLRTGVLQGGLPTDFLDAVASARHSLNTGTSSGAPMRVTLNP